MLQPIFSSAWSSVGCPNHSAQFDVGTSHVCPSSSFPHTSVKNTFILGMTKTTESFGSVRTLIDAMYFDEVSILFPRAKLVLCADLKMVNLLCGIGKHSSRFPDPFTLYSGIAKHSEPDVIRTSEMYETDLASYRARISVKTSSTQAKAKKSGSATPKPISSAAYHSVECEPIDFLKANATFGISFLLCHSCI